LLSGERKDEITFLSLFGLPGTALDFESSAPSALSALANQLPGTSIGAILAANTYVPLVMSVANSLDWHRPTLRFGICNTCMQCLLEDETREGVAYIRRGHQLPGVVSCARHGLRLIDACPNCLAQFNRPGKFLAAPLIPCACGWEARNGGPAIQGTAAEQGFAANAQSVLEERTIHALVSDLIKFFDLHIAPTKIGLRRDGVMFRSLLAEHVSRLLAEGRPIAEVAETAAKIVASSQEPNWWIATLNRKVLEERAVGRQAVD